jgi:hypothetical protein
MILFNTRVAPGAGRNSGLLLLAHAPGIEAEILLVCQKIGANSPVFCGFAAKKAPKFPL